MVYKECEPIYCLNVVVKNFGVYVIWEINHVNNKKAIKCKEYKFKVTAKKGIEMLSLVWRHLKNKTRNKLIKTVNMSFKKLNIKYMKHN